MEPVGLAVGVLGLAGLFSTCLDAFKIVVSAREFGHDFEVLIADLDLQRLRFYLWGDALGLVSTGPNRSPVRLAGLDDPQIDVTVRNALQAILRLLKETGRTRDRFTRAFYSTRRLEIFHATFSPFEQRAEANQRGNSLVAVTKWAFHSREQFKERLDRLKSLIEGLENVSQSLGVLQMQRQRMRTEIESLDDVASLSLLLDATLDDQQDASDAASVRILAIAGTSVHSPNTAHSVVETFFTAPRDPSSGPSADDAIQNDHMIDHDQSMLKPQTERIAERWADLEVHAPLWKTGPKTEKYGSILAAFDIDSMALSMVFPQSLSYVQLALSASYVDEPPSIYVADIDKGNYRTRRMAKDLAQHQKSRVSEPWVAYAPILARLDHILAAIEGPPDTPYEDGVFWIEIKIPRDYPFRPCEVHFLTRIYHPNIDSKGQICLDILGDQWFVGFTLGRVLVSVCSILDDPGLDDPLVPEIAEMYRRDYDLYCQNARAYTAKYACASLHDK